MAMEKPVAKPAVTAKAKARVEQSWRGCGALNAWLGAHVGPSEMAPPERYVR